MADALLQEAQDISGDLWQEESPNEITIAAMKEAERIAHDPSVKRYVDVEEALAALKA